MTIKIKVSTTNPEVGDLLLRQSPFRSGRWLGCEFYINKPIDKCDWWVICHRSSLRKIETELCDPDHIIFLSMEPFESGVPKDFFEQFSALVLTDTAIQHRKVFFKNAITWWAGIEVRFDNGHKFLPTVNYDYNKFQVMPWPKKINRISVITSNNSHLSGHKKRLDFIDKLRMHPVSQHIDFYGGGHRPVLDKLDGLLQYKYHLVLENCSIPNFWSEKIADPFLAFCFPIYYGCPNINDYFPNKSLLVVDIDDFDATVQTLEFAIASDLYSERRQHIIEARELVLTKYNIFQLMADICTSKARRLEECKIKPPRMCRPLGRRLASFVYRKVRSAFFV